MFRFTGGLLLRAVFPTFTDELASSLNQIIARGSDEDYDFASRLLENYHGETPTHEVIKARFKWMWQFEQFGITQINSKIAQKAIPELIFGSLDRSNCHIDLRLPWTMPKKKIGELPEAVRPDVVAFRQRFRFCFLVWE